MPRTDGTTANRQTISLSAFIGIARTTFRAGVAAIVMGALVKGLIPGLALIADDRCLLVLSA